MQAAKRRIAVVPGDGIGVEVIREASELLELLNRRRGLDLTLWQLDLGAERYLRDKTTMPREVFDEIRDTCGAVLLGALGDPRVPDLAHARDILFGFRFGLDLYANIRPVKCLDDRLCPLKGRTARDVDFTVFRENTEGVYVNVGGQVRRGTPDEIAINEDINTRKGVERIIRAAFAFAKAHGKKTIHMADKSNAMRQTHKRSESVLCHLAVGSCPDGGNDLHGRLIRSPTGQWVPPNRVKVSTGAPPLNMDQAVADRTEGDYPTGFGRGREAIGYRLNHPGPLTEIRSVPTVENQSTTTDVSVRDMRQTPIAVRVEP